MRVCVNVINSYSLPLLLSLSFFNDEDIYFSDINILYTYIDFIMFYGVCFNKDMCATAVSSVSDITVISMSITIRSSAHIKSNNEKCSLI